MTALRAAFTGHIHGELRASETDKGDHEPGPAEGPHPTSMQAIQGPKTEGRKARSGCHQTHQEPESHSTKLYSGVTPGSLYLRGGLC